MSDYWKKKLDDLNKTIERTSSSQSSSNESRRKAYDEHTASVWENVLAKNKQKDKKWYETGLFEDGYDFGDVTKSILGISDKKELKTFTAPETTDSLDVLKKKVDYYKGRKWLTADQTKESLNVTQQYNQMALAQYSDTLSKTKMDGTNHTVLDEIEILANMKSGKEKDERKAKVLAKMEELGMDTAFYSHFAGDGEFEWDTFGSWLGNSAMAGLNMFNKGLLDTADVLLGAPLREMGWENNPISEGAEYYGDLYSSYRYNADLMAEKLGGDAWNFGSSAVEGTVGALPNALLMFMTGGTSATATTSSLTNQAAMQTGNILTKAGLTTEAMMKNPQYWMTFARELGPNYKEAKELGASDTAAAVGSVLKATVNSGLEIGLDGGSGIQGLPSALKEGGKPFWEWVESSVEEGGEEILQKFVGEIINKFGYGSDEEILNPIEYAKEGTIGMISGMALGGGQTVVQSGANAYATHQANKLTDIETAVKDRIVQNRIAKQEKDGKTLTAKEKANIDKEVERNLRKGYLKAEEIEEAVGGDIYETFSREKDAFFGSDVYKNYTKDSKRIEKLEKQVKDADGQPGTVGNIKRYEAIQNRLNILKARNDKAKATLDAEAQRIMGIRGQMRTQVMDAVKDSRLAESYRELERSKQSFQTDVSKYTNENAKKTVQSILDSGLGDNSNQFHETVEWLAKLSEERNVTFDLTKTERLKGTKHYREGYVTNGFKTKNGDLTNITINLDGNYLNTTVGHEITHVLEEAGIYVDLSEAVKAFAIAKEGQEGYNKRINAIKEIYGDDKATIDSELTADIIGEYLFTDYDFVNSLSTENRNVFQKIYDEVKYLLKIATADSREARELEKVKKMFDKAWKENIKGKPETDADVEGDVDGEADVTQHSITVDDKKTLDFLNEQLQNGEVTKVYRAMQVQPVDENGDVIKATVLRVVSQSPLMVEAQTFGKDGKVAVYPARLFSPMAGMVDGKWSKNIELNKWEQTTYDFANAYTVIDPKTGKPKIDNDKKNASYGEVAYFYGLVKGGIDKSGKKLTDVPARYNPYIHTSLSALNDQFSSANKRPELVTVECIIPNSELTSGERAEGAKDRVGAMSWHSGPTSSRLAKVGKARTVILTRYDMPVRVLPDSEVAQAVADYIGDSENIAIKGSTVTPSLSQELMNLGISVLNDEQWSQYDKDFPTKTFGKQKKTNALGKKILDTKSIQYSYSAIPSHKKSLEKNFDFDNASLDLETINQRYDKIIGIWEKLGGELDSKFLNDWNNKVERPFTIFKAQSGYKYNVELSSMCKKGVPLFEAIDTIVKKEVMKELDMKVMGKEEKEILYDILKQKHFEIPCAICYVEQARQREGVVIDAFLNGKAGTDKKGADVKLGWNQVLDSIQKEMKANGVDYNFNFVSRDIATDKYIPAESQMDEQTYTAFAEAIKKVANEEITRYNKANNKHRPLLKDVTPEAVKECFKGSLPSNLKIFKVLLTEPSSRFKIQNDLLYSSMTTKNLTMAHNGLYGLFNSQGGVSGYKTKQAPTVYWGEILNKKWKPDATRKEGGIRNQSNSDFQMYTLLDQAQMYMDFSAKGYYLQAYTKVLSELKLFGLSRGKINASLIPQVKVYRNADGSVDVEKTMENAGLDENGNPIYDDIEGINHTEAFMLLEDPEYSKNIGGICIGYSDNHIRKLLDDNRVQLIIGFHDKTNDPNKRYRGARYAKNYNGLNEATKLKTDGTSETVHIGFNPFIKKAEQKFQYNKDTETFEGTINYKGKTYTADDIPRLATDLYLEHCAKKNLTPAYNEFHEHQNYYKLLADFSLYDSEGHYAPHQKVAYNMPDTVPYLDADGNKQYMGAEEYIKIELQKELAVRDSLIEALSDDSEDGIIPRFKAEVNKRNIAPVQYSMTKLDTDYMDAVNRGDTESMQKMVDEAAEKAGYTIKGYHGTKDSFTVFERGQSHQYDSGYLGSGFYFTDSKDSAKDYSQWKKGYDGSRVINASLRMKNPLVIEDTEKPNLIAVQEALGIKLTDFGNFLAKPNKAISDAITNEAKSQGYDGIIRYSEFYDETTYVVFDSNQVKSADPVTYDDSGNVIPLSKRFDSSQDDIRYSMSRAEELENAYQYDLENYDFLGAEMVVEEMANLAMPDSKIRDKKGRLIPVYHGTYGDFWEFDTSISGGKNGTAEGFGIYLSDNQEVTNAYGDRQIKMFANITKPATSFKKTIKATTLTKLIKQTCERQAKQMVEEEGYDSIKDAIRDTWVSNYVDTYSSSMDQAYREVANSMIQQNDNDKDIVHEVMFGMAIRSYDQAMDFYKNSLTPVTGIDGFITKWENANTGSSSNIYLAFDSSQLKSADAVTYDESGKVIPLADRFNAEKKDIRYSMTKDSTGRELTAEQSEFFKDSKVRNESGELTPMYHGTPDGSFNEFKISDTLNTIMSAQGAGYYFTNKKNAEQYMKPVNKSVRRGAEAKMYEVYLNITNPMEIRPYERTITKEQFKEVLRKGNKNWFKTDWMPFYLPGDQYANRKLDFETLLDQYTERIFARNQSDGDILAEITRAFNGGDETILKAMSEVFGNDGVHFADGYGDIWVAWSANQIKNVDNANPTIDPDIRYSISKGKKNTSGDWHIDGGDFGYTEDFGDFAPVREDVADPTVETVADNVKATEAPIREDIPEKETKEKPKSEEAVRIAQRKQKNNEHTLKWESLIGNTTTWVDMPTGLSYKTKTLRRILRKVVRDARGNPDIKRADAIYDELETKYDHNEALLKRESSKLKEGFQQLKLNHAEDEYAQMLGELRYNPETTLTEDVVGEFLKKHKGKIDEAKVNKAIKDARKLYDDLLVRVNEVLREQGFKEIPYRKGYFPHFSNPKQNWFQKMMNWKVIDNEIPTSIAGLTEMFKPNRSWQSFNKQRTGDKTDYSLYQGLDTYIHGALDWIYHIDDLQSRRSLENLIRYTHSDKGIQERIDAIKESNLDAEEAQRQIDAVLAEARNPLSGLVRELMNRTNTLANKKSSMDRGVEDMVNRKIYSTMTNINNRITANQVVGSLSSALTNFIPIVQSWHQVSPAFTVVGLGDFVRSTIKDDGMVSRSDFLTNRLMEEEKLYQTGWDKVTDKAAFMMNVVDGITSQTVWRSKYHQNLHEGKSEAQAIRDADQFAKNLMAGRSRGNAPTIFDAKNPFVKMFTAFQLEVANQYGYMFDDVPKDSKNMVRLVKGYATAFLGAYMYNALYSSVVGRDAAFDPIKIIEDLMAGLLDDEEEKEDVMMDFGEDILEQVPYIGGLLGGGRVPISSALPYSNYNTPLQSMLDDIKEGKDDGNWEPLIKEMLKPLYYIGMPVAGGQIKKTIEGLSMFSDDHPMPGSYTTSGNLRFPVDDTIGSRVQAALFGQYSSENARKYFDEEYSTLYPDQVEIFKHLDMPIEEYWEYRDNLSSFKETKDDLKTIANSNMATDEDILKSKYASAVYSDMYDLYDEQKVIVAGNGSEQSKKTKVQALQNQMAQMLSKAQGEMDNIYINGYYATIGDKRFDYSDYSHKWYEINGEYLEREQNAIERYGVTPEDYWNNTDLYYNADYYFKYNPERADVSKIVFDGKWFAQYAAEVSQIKGEDLNNDGRTDTNSKKKNIFAYIDSLNVSDIERKILRKMSYTSEKTYNRDIAEYIINLDASHAEKKKALESLGYTVDAEGYISWKE